VFVFIICVHLCVLLCYYSIVTRYGATENAAVEKAGARVENAGVGKLYGKPNLYYTLRDP